MRRSMIEYKTRPKLKAMMAQSIWKSIENSLQKQATLKGYFQDFSNIQYCTSPE
jgi:hypothetical protein